MSAFNDVLVMYLIPRQHNDYLAYSRYIVPHLILLHKHHKQINFFPQSKALSKPPFLTTTSAPHSLSSKTPAPQELLRSSFPIFQVGDGQILLQRSESPCRQPSSPFCGIFVNYDTTKPRHPKTSSFPMPPFGS